MAVNLGINDFISKFDGGSKPNLYRVSVTGNAPVQAISTANFSFFCKSASLPASTLGEISVPYLGRVVKVPGDRTYDDWSVSIVNNETLPLRKLFEQWNEVYNGHVSNMPNVTGSIYAHVKTCSASVEQLDRSGNTVRKYTLLNCFPKDVAAIDVGYDSVDTISEFGVTFGYTHFTLS